MRGKDDIWKINVGRSLRISKLSCIRRSNGFVLYISRCGDVREVRRERRFYVMFLCLQHYVMQIFVVVNC